MKSREVWIEDYFVDNCPEKLKIKQKFDLVVMELLDFWCDQRFARFGLYTMGDTQGLSCCDISPCGDEATSYIGIVQHIKLYKSYISWNYPPGFSGQFDSVPLLLRLTGEAESFIDEERRIKVNASQNFPNRKVSITCPRYVIFVLSLLCCVTCVSAELDYVQAFLIDFCVISISWFNVYIAGLLLGLTLWWFCLTMVGWFLNFNVRSFADSLDSLFYLVLDGVLIGVFINDPGTFWKYQFCKRVLGWAFIVITPDTISLVRRDITRGQNLNMVLLGFLAQLPAVALADDGYFSGYSGGDLVFHVCIGLLTFCVCFLTRNVVLWLGVLRRDLNDDVNKLTSQIEKECEVLQQKADNALAMADEAMLIPRFLNNQFSVFRFRDVLLWPYRTVRMYYQWHWYKANFAIVAGAGVLCLGYLHKKLKQPRLESSNVFFSDCYNIMKAVGLFTGTAIVTRDFHFVMQGLEATGTLLWNCISSISDTYNEWRESEDKELVEVAKEARWTQVLKTSKNKPLENLAEDRANGASKEENEFFIPEISTIVLKLQKTRSTYNRVVSLFKFFCQRFDRRLAAFVCSFTFASVALLVYHRGGEFRTKLRRLLVREKPTPIIEPVKVESQAPTTYVRVRADSPERAAELFKDVTAAVSKVTDGPSEISIESPAPSLNGVKVLTPSGAKTLLQNKNLSAYKCIRLYNTAKRNPDGSYPFKDIPNPNFGSFVDKLSPKSGPVFLFPPENVRVINDTHFSGDDPVHTHQITAPAVSLEAKQRVVSKSKGKGRRKFIYFVSGDNFAYNADAWRYIKSHAADNEDYLVAGVDDDLEDKYGGYDQYDNPYDKYGLEALVGDSPNFVGFMPIVDALYAGLDASGKVVQYGTCTSIGLLTVNHGLGAIKAWASYKDYRGQRVKNLDPNVVDGPKLWRVPDDGHQIVARVNPEVLLLHPYQGMVQLSKRVFCSLVPVGTLLGFFSPNMQNLSAKERFSTGPLLDVKRVADINVLGLDKSVNIGLYRFDTMPGDCGLPVFTEQGQIVMIHCVGSGDFNGGCVLSSDKDNGLLPLFGTVHLKC